MSLKIFISRSISFQSNKIAGVVFHLYLNKLISRIWHKIATNVFICGNLSYWSNEGLEKLNDLTTHDFFSMTNKSKTFIKQMLEKDVRLSDSTFLR